MITLSDLDKMKPTSLAYTYDWNLVEESYLYDEIQHVVYAESRNKAKAKLLNDAQIMGVVFTHIDEPTYLNIPVKRAKEHDKYLIDGTLYTKHTYAQKLQRDDHQKDLDAILANDEIKYCFIRKRGYYYCDNCSGYTSNIEEAGRYNKEFACRECKGEMNMYAEPIDIEKYNAMLQKAIEYLKSRML